MKKQKISVPKGVRYISEWEDYRLEDYNFPHILNKVLTGCGFTEYCIRNDQNLILLSPRRFLLENKEDQHPGELYYARSEFSGIVDYELDISKSHKKTLVDNLPSEEIKSLVLKMKEKIKDYCRERSYRSKKILVTYDSFRHVKEALQELGIFQSFQVVVDEFQSIFIDSHFKSTTELELLKHLEGVQKLCYVSATPMLDKYLDMLDEFKSLPYFELDWESEDPRRIVHPRLEIKFTGKSMNDEAKRVIESYKSGNYEQRLDPKTGGFFESREATIFMNSVSGICQVIRTNRLHTDECNILCARTKENEKEVRRAFNEVLRKETENEKTHPKVPKEYEVIGRIPKKGDPHKQFTFCTRTVYLGADFYSTNSQTFIFSDANIDSLSVDISMDLEQILGRQRLDENPWKNSAKLFVKTINKEKTLTEEFFKEYLNKKIDKTKRLLNVYNNTKDTEDKIAIAEKYESDVKHEYYKKDYVAVNYHDGKNLKPVFNNLVLVSEIRTFEIQQIDYKDRFSVFASIKEEGYVKESDDASWAVDEFEKLGNVKKKFRFIVKYTTETPGVTEQQINCFLAQIPAKYSDYYRLLGPDRIKANSYQESRIKEEWIKAHSESKIEDEMIGKIYSTFQIGEKYGKAKIKSMLKDIYASYNYDKTAKASDLTDYFVLKTTSAKEDNKWVPGFEILGKR